MGFGDILDLRFRITTDTKDAQKDVDGLKAIVAGLARNFGESFDQLQDRLVAATGRAGAFADSLKGIGPAAVGVTAVIGGVAALTGVMFKLAKETAEAGSEIFDLAQKANVSAELLSTLKVAADSSGGSINAIAESFARFRDRALDAVTGGKETASAFRFLGIEASDALENTDQAVRRVIDRFNAAGSETERLAILTAAFGRKLASDLIPVINQLGGDLGEAIEKAREMGAVFDDQAAAASDNFGDALDDLSRTIQGLTHSVGKELLPTFTTSFEQIKLDLTTARPLFVDLGQTGARFLEVLARGAANAATNIAAVKAALKGDFSKLKDINVNPFRELTAEEKVELDVQRTLRIEEEALERQRLAAQRKFSNARLSLLSDHSAKEKKLRDTTSRDEIDLIKATLESEEQLYEERTRAIKDKYEAQSLSAVEAFDQIAAAADRLHQARMLALRQEREAQTASKTQPGRDAQTQEFLNNQNKIDANRTNALREAADALKESEERRGKAVSKETADLERSKKQWEKYANDVTEQLIRIHNAEVELEATRDLRRKKQAADAEAARQRILTETNAADPTSNLSIFGVDALGEQTRFQALTESILGGLGDASKGLGTFRDLAAGVFSAVASASQQMLSAFILTGKAGAVAFKKLAADVIAALVIQSAVAAIFELAAGFAALAWGDPATAAKHFTAAKIYGTVAGVAAAAAAAIGAGGGFGAGSEASTGGQFGGTTQQRPNDVTITRGGTQGGLGVGTGGQDVLGIGGLAAAIESLDNKISSMRPGDVITVGAAQATEAIGRAVVTEAQRSAEFTNQFGRIIFGPV